MSTKFTKQSIHTISLEDAHGGSGKRQVLIKPEHVTSKHFEMMTKGYLNPGFSYDWHDHKDTDEMFIVLQGEGIFFWEKEEAPYQEGDVFTIPANSLHKITASGGNPSEFYFIRIKV